MINKKILISLGVLTLLITGCSNKIPDAKPVKWHKDSALSINKEFTLQREFKVPKDPHLQYVPWTYQAIATKGKKYLFKNEDIIRVFLAAHNASEIIIIGRPNLIQEYKDYFVANQVTTNIKLQAVKPIKEDYNTVNILFFNDVGYSKDDSHQE